MIPTSFVVLSLLCLFAEASPVSRGESPVDSAVVVFAILQDSPIHHGLFAANGSAIWIGKNTASYCPPVVEERGECPKGKDTSFWVNDRCGMVRATSYVFFRSWTYEVKHRMLLSLVASKPTSPLTGESRTQRLTPLTYLRGQSQRASTCSQHSLTASGNLSSIRTSCWHALRHRGRDRGKSLLQMRIRACRAAILRIA